MIEKYPLPGKSFNRLKDEAFDSQPWRYSTVPNHKLLCKGENACLKKSPIRFVKSMVYLIKTLLDTITYLHREFITQYGSSLNRNYKCYASLSLLLSHIMVTFIVSLKVILYIGSTSSQ